MEANILFHSTPVYAGLTGRVDPESATLHGVALIHSEIEADGHGLWIDKTLLSQLSALGQAKGQIQCNIDHGSGSSSTVGFIDGFRIEGDVLRGDLHLLKSHNETPIILEKAERMPSGVGLSAAFKGNPKGVLVNGKQCARAEKLLSFDLVSRPAAAPNGLFSAKDESVDSSQKVNMDTKADQEAKEPTLTEVMEAVKALQANFEGVNGVVNQLVDHVNQSAEQGATSDEDRAILEQLYNSSEEQLAQLGITRAEVDAAVAEYNAGVTGAEGGEDGGEGGEGTDGGTPGGGEAAAGANGMAGVSSNAPATFESMQKHIINLEARLNARDQREKQAVEEQNFAAVEGKIVTLAEQNVQLKEFAANKAAEVDALREHLRTGTRPVKPGVDTGVKLFSANENGELHPWQEKIKKIELEKKVTPGEAIMLADKEDNGALHASYLQSLQKETIHA